MRLASLLLLCSLAFSDTAVLVPTSDSATGTWVTAPLFSKVDEDIDSFDSTIITSPNNPATPTHNVVFTVACPANTQTVTAANLRVRWNKNSATGRTINPTITWSATGTTTFSTANVSATAANYASGNQTGLSISEATCNASTVTISTTTTGSGGARALVVDAVNLDITYTAEAADTTPPVRSDGAPSGTLHHSTTSTSISLTTDENATCKYDTTPGTAYASMPTTFSSTGLLSHSTTVSGLSSGNTYNYYVRCVDAASNANTTDYTITFSVDNAPAGRPDRTFSLESCGTQVVQANQTTCWNADRVTWTDGTVSRLATFGSAEATFAGITISGGTAECERLASQVNCVFGGLTAGTRIFTLPDTNEWFPSRPLVIISPNQFSHAHAPDIEARSFVLAAFADTGLRIDKTFQFAAVSGTNTLRLFFDGIAVAEVACSSGCDVTISAPEGSYTVKHQRLQDSTVMFESANKTVTM